MVSYWSRRAAMKAGALASLGAFAGELPAFADSAADFYHGKSLDLVVGYPTGGSNDIFSRIVAQYLGPCVAGEPQTIMRNMPGAGSLVAANYMSNTAARDGTVIGAVSADIPLQAKLGNSQARYDPDKFAWIGRIAPSQSVTMVWHTSKIITIEDAQKHEVTLGETGAGSTGSLYPNIMNAVLKTKFKLVRGYDGTGSAMLAMSRGEVEGHSTTWEAVKSVHPDWIRGGQVRILVQHGLKRAADMPNVPTSVELAQSPEDKALMRLIMGAAEVGKAYFTTPNTPPDRVAALRRGFELMVTKPEFIAAIKNIHGDVDPMRGEDMQKLIAGLDDLPPDVVQRAKALYAAG